MEQKLTAIQIATANKYFAKELNKHSEMPLSLSNDGECLSFYWASSKKVKGKTHCCVYNFYPKHYEITKYIYNEYGCFWDRKTKREYKNSK